MTTGLMHCIPPPFPNVLDKQLSCLSRDRFLVFWFPGSQMMQKEIQSPVELMQKVFPYLF